MEVLFLAAFVLFCGLFFFFSSEISSFSGFSNGF